MTRLALLVCTLAPVMWGQARPARPAATTPVATIDGKPFTVGDLQSLLRNAPETVLLRLKEDPKGLLVNYTLTVKMAGEARAAGLDQKYPYKQRLDWDAYGVLMNAQLQKMLDAIEIPETEIRQQYEKNILQYRTMQATAIRVLNAQAGGAAQAKAKAEEAVKQAREGVSFVELGAKYSSEPDLAKPSYANTITPSFDLPEAAKKRLFATLPGQVTDPIELKDSFVVFRVEKLAAKPLADVRGEIRAELQQQRSGSELARIQQGIQVKVLQPEFFRANAANTDTGNPVAAGNTDVVAEVNGKGIPARQMFEELQGMAPNARQAAGQDPAAFLLQYETMKQLAAKAREGGLDKTPPASDHIFWTSGQTLLQAQLDEKTKAIISSLEEQQAYYRDQADQFRLAKTRLIYLAFALSPPPGSKQRNEEQAMALAREIKQKAESGTAFPALVAQYSEEADSKSRGGEMGLRFADPNLPPAIRDAVFQAKDGQVAGPVRLPNGVYLFLVEQNTKQPFEEVRNDIYNALSDAKFKAWFDGYRDKIQVTITDEAALRAELAYH